PAARPQGMGMGQDWADEAGLFVGKEGVEGEDGRQAAVNGRCREAALSLNGNEAVYVLNGDCRGRTVAHRIHELLQVTAVVAPGMSLRIAPADPVDKAVDFIEHELPPTE